MEPPKKGNPAPAKEADPKDAPLNDLPDSPDGPLSDLPQPGDSIEDVQDKSGQGGKETPPAPSSEKKPGEETPPSDGKKSDDINLPFHKHPRFKQLNNENKDLRARLEKLEQRQDNPAPAAPETPEWFSKRYGNNPELYKQYQEANDTYKKQIKDELLAEMKEEATREQREQEQVNAWVQEKLSELHDGGEEFDDKALLKVMQEWRPITDDGTSLDFQKGLALLKQFEVITAKNTTEQEKAEARKKIGGMTDTKPNAAPPSQPTVNMNEIHKSSWNQLARG